MFVKAINEASIDLQMSAAYRISGAKTYNDAVPTRSEISKMIGALFPEGKPNVDHDMVVLAAMADFHEQLLHLSDAKDDKLGVLESCLQKRYEAYKGRGVVSKVLGATTANSTKHLKAAEIHMRRAFKGLSGAGTFADKITEVKGLDRRVKVYGQVIKQDVEQPSQLSLIEQAEKYVSWVKEHPHAL